MTEAYRSSVLGHTSGEMSGELTETVAEKAKKSQSGIQKNGLG